MLAATSLTGCSNPFANDDCVAIGVYGVTAYVRDATTLGPPTAPVTVRFTDGAYVEIVTTPFPGSNPATYAAALERPGRYEVQVEAIGYATDRRTDVQVTRGGKCNALRPVRLDVVLTPTR